MIPTLTTPQQVTTYLADHSPVPANPITLNISLWFWAIGFILIIAAALDTQQQYLYQLSTIGYSIWILAFFLILIQTIEISVHATLSGIILLTLLYSSIRTLMDKRNEPQTL